MLPSHFGVPLEDSARSRDQFQEETGEVTSQVALWVSRPMPCLPLPRQHEVLLVDGQYLLVGRPHVLHPYRLDVLETLGTQLSPQNLEILPWSPICTGIGYTSAEIHPCSPTHCLDASQYTHLVQPTGHAFDGGFVFHTMMTSSARKTVCVRGRARTESSMRSRMDTSA